MLGSPAVAQVLVVMGGEIARYGFPEGHPFGVDRHAAFAREFDARGLAGRVRLAPPGSARDEEILLFHTPRYLQFVRERSCTGQGCLDGGDTPAFRGVYEASASVVGATLLAARALMRGEAARAFVPIAGLHHAARDHAAGFCVFNDIGVAIEVLRREFGLERIAYVDIDAHHGDGVFYAYESDPGVIVADVHEDGSTLYPGTGSADETGKGAAQGTKLNLPLPAGADDGAFAAVWPRLLEFVAAGRPQFVILQCGADSIAGDPITHLGLSAGAHARAARELCTLADRLGHGRVLALGGGGYNRANLAAAWNDVVEALAA
ncbi:MAG: acetoin utilization protein AcuC [Steroidobacteraceae bacterium]